MSITLAEAVEKARADGGRLVYEEPTGGRTEVVVPEPSDDGDWGPPYLDAPYIPPLPGTRVKSVLGDPFPMKPIVIDDSDLAPDDV